MTMDLHVADGVRQTWTLKRRYGEKEMDISRQWQLYQNCQIWTPNRG